MLRVDALLEGLEQDRIIAAEARARGEKVCWTCLRQAEAGKLCGKCLSERKRGTRAINVYSQEFYRSLSNEMREKAARLLASERPHDAGASADAE
jgi:hypothetical protein